MAGKYIKTRRFTLLVIRKMQIRSIMEYNYKHIRVPRIKKVDDIIYS